jgi:hypothetical protein
VLAFAGGSGTVALLATGVLDLLIAAFFAFLLLGARVPGPGTALRGARS